MVRSRNHRRINYAIKSNHQNCDDRNHCDDRKGILQKGPWSREEDIWLINHVEQNGPCEWKKIASKLERTSKSCRLRWFNQLSPDIRHELFTAEEDEIIINMVHTIGGKWARIARVLKGRTDNQVKNQWHSRLKKMHVNGTSAPNCIKLSRTAAQKAKRTHKNLNASFPSQPQSFSAPLPTLISTSAEPVYLEPPPFLNASLPCITAGSINYYFHPAPVAPYSSVKQMRPPTSLYADPAPVPSSALDWLTSLDLSPPGCQMPDVMYSDLFPGPSPFDTSQLQQRAPIGECTAMIMDIIGNEGEANCTSGFDGSNQPEC